MQVATLIGDVVASRQSPDRARLQDQLSSVLAEVSELIEARLAMTLGDEFQGRFDRLDTAIAASWHLHVRTLGIARLRIGLGWGEIFVDTGQAAPFGQDGPAWWRARDAIEVVESTSHPLRTVVKTETEWDPMMNAYLTLRDTHLDSLDATDAAILVGLQAGETQRALADRLGLHESSVSRRVSRHLLAVLTEVTSPSLPAFHP